MRKPQRSRHLLFGKKNKRDDRGSAIVIVIIAMALIGILASTILWASYLNYRIKINDLKVKNSFYSAETVVEQILAGVKKDIVSASVNEAYQEVVSNWDALGTDDNREGYFITAYIASVESKLKASPAGAPNQYDKAVIEAFVDSEMWLESDPNHDGHIDKDIWDAATPTFKAANAVNGYGSMAIRNICVEYYDSEGLLSIINTDIAIDVPKLRFTQAGTVDRLYPYVLIGDNGIVTEDGKTINVNGNIYGGVDTSPSAAADNGGIRIGSNSRVTVEDASYIISGGDIVVGNDSIIGNLVHQGAELIVRDVTSGGVGFKTNVYAQGLAVNGSHLDISGKVFIANDLILSGRSSDVSLAGQYFGYGATQTTTDSEEQSDGTTKSVNPAETSSAIVINGRDSSVDLTGLNTLQLAGRAYVSLSTQENVDDDGLPHVLMGESISVKSNQIAYLVPAECVGTLDGRTIIGQNPMSYEAWGKMITSLAEYAEDDTQIFKIVDADRAAVKLGGERLFDYGIKDLNAKDLDSLDPDNIVQTVTTLNEKAANSGVRFLYMADKRQVYMYLVMDQNDAERYFTAYYNVNSNKASLDSYFNQYVSGGIRLKDNVQGYTVLGNSMVSLTDAANGDKIQTSDEGENLVRLLSSVTLSEDEEGEGEGDEEQPVDPDAYTEVSDNVTNIETVKTYDELQKLIESTKDTYDYLNNNLLEDGMGMADTVFENLIRLESTEGSESTEGLQDYLDGKGGLVEFVSGSGLKAVLVDSNKQSGKKYKVSDSKLRLVIAIGDVEVTSNFQGLIIASGTVKIADNVTCKKDGEGVYEVLQAKSTVDGDDNVPANILYNGTGMIKSGYEEADVDENGNLNINYSEIVRYENWIKK